ncbi:hypothetical protein V1505DRAFT_109063 [Lipomyces doorenjongii]
MRVLWVRLVSSIIIKSCISSFLCFCVFVLLLYCCVVVVVVVVLLLLLFAVVVCRCYRRRRCYVVVVLCCSVLLAIISIGFVVYVIYIPIYKYSASFSITIYCVYNMSNPESIKVRGAKVIDI